MFTPTHRLYAQATNLASRCPTSPSIPAAYIIEAAKVIKNVDPAERYTTQDAGKPPAANEKNGTSGEANPIELADNTGLTGVLPVYPPSRTMKATNLVTSRARHSTLRTVQYTDNNSTRTTV